jgi:hypothetical protein
MILIDSNAILIDFEGTELLGKAMKPIKWLIIEMQNIWERYMDNIR